MTQKKLLIEKNKNIITLILNRPEVHNAFDSELIKELRMTLAEIKTDTTMRAVILKSNGHNFSAGADLNWMRQTLNFSEEQNTADAMQLANLMDELFHLNKPTLALVQGAAYGGAVGLIACCDIAIAEETANFCLSEVKIGLIPAVISPYIIQAIGHKQARRYCITAENFDAHKAKELGLINEVTSAALLEETANRIIKAILNNSPHAIMAIKNLLNDITETKFNNDVIEKTATAIAKIRVSKEGQEGLTAFLEKRKPYWQLYS